MRHGRSMPGELAAGSTEERGIHPSRMLASRIDLDRQTPMYLPFDLHVSHRQQAGVQGSVCERVATDPASAFEQDWHGRARPLGAPKRTDGPAVRPYLEPMIDAVGQRGWHEDPSQRQQACRATALLPQKPSGRGVKPPTEPLPGRKTGPLSAKRGPNWIFVRASCVTNPFSKSLAPLRISPSQMAPAICLGTCPPSLRELRRGH
jgi:hypothetical protein